MNSSLQCYIEFDWQVYVEIGHDYFKKLYSLVNLAKMHDCKLFYSKNQLKEFVTECRDLDENFSKSVGNSIEIIVENIISKKINESLFFRIEYNKESSYIELVDLNILNILDEEESIKVIINLSREDSLDRYLKVNDTKTDLVDVKFIKSTESLVNFFSKEFEKRNFNLSPKHGENGIGHWNGESSLLCNKQQAQVLLDKSIGDFAVKKRRLFYFDENHNCYIEFFYEGENPQKQWHGFHITENLWNQRVPNEVKKFFNKN